MMKVILHLDKEKELSAREAIAEGLCKAEKENPPMLVPFKLEVSLWCEGSATHVGPREMKLTTETEDGVRYFKCIECNNEVSIMLQSTL